MYIFIFTRHEGRSVLTLTENNISAARDVLKTGGSPAALESYI